MKPAKAASTVRIATGTPSEIPGTSLAGAWMSLTFASPQKARKIIRNV